MEGQIYTVSEVNGFIKNVIEHWHHSAGCRRWLVVERDNAASHEVYSVTDASAYAKEAAR